MKKYFGVIAILFLVSILSGCGKTLAEKNAENILENSFGQNAEVEVKDNSIAVETSDGALSTGDLVKLPNNFPKDIYLIDGKILSSYNDSSTDSFMVLIENNQSLLEVEEIYTKELTASAWQIISKNWQNNTLTLFCQKDNRNVMVSANLESEKTTITLIVNKTTF